MPQLPSQEQVVPDAGVLRDVISAYHRLDAAEGERIESLFSESSVILNMADPLKVDLGVHEWLRGRREENYSAWLAWCLRQLRPSEVLEVLGLEDPDGIDEQPTFPVVNREFRVPSGEAGKSGRLDILVYVTSTKVVAIEVKTGSADVAMVLKHAGYVASLTQMFPAADRLFVLVAKQGSRSDYHGFQLLSWRDLALALRRRIPSVCVTVGIAQAAMMAGFVGAVERNILGLNRGDAAQLAWYLEEFVRAQS